MAKFTPGFIKNRFKKVETNDKTSVPNEQQASENEAVDIQAEEILPVAEEHAPTQEEVEVKLHDKDAVIAEWEDRYMRLAAEFDNFRKRTVREKQALIEYASESVITALLPVLDNFQRSLTAMEKTDNLSSVRDGIRLVHENMQRILKKEGLESIESVGLPFDSAVHEAITTIPVEEENRKGKVVDEAEKGYRLKDKVIRCAKVIVGE